MRTKKSQKNMLVSLRSKALTSIRLRCAFAYLAVLSLFVFTNITLAQQASKPASNANKADQNLKAIARINPSTLAMEFSIPLGVYPGRSGNSIPVSFNYSSKLWQLNIFDSKFDDVVSGYQRFINDFRKASLTYSPNSASGWDTTLRSPRIVKADRLFFEFGEDVGSNYGAEDISNELIQEMGDSFSSNVGSSFPSDPATACEPANVRGQICERCVTVVQLSPTSWNLSYWSTCTGGGGGGPTPTPTPRQLRIVYVVKRVQVQMPDGSTVEFRKGDKVYNCLNEECLSEIDGTYLAVNGSKMRFEKNELQSDQQTRRDVLYLPDGSRYLFPVPNPNNPTPGVPPEAEEYIDVDGNKMLYDASEREWTDTLGRNLNNPLPTQNLSTPLEEGTQTFTLPGMGTQNQQYELVWKKLKTTGCEDSTDPNCGYTVLEDPSQELYYAGSDTCQGWDDNSVSPSLFTGISTTTVTGVITRTTKRKFCAAQFNETPARFNPVVLAEIKLPNQKSYTFKYNRYGEITRINYPTGGHEQFRYDEVLPIGFDMDLTYNKVNRGVVERWVSDGTNIIQHWEYETEDIGTAPTVHRVIRTIAPDGSKTERYINRSVSQGYGFEDAYSGMPYEERGYDTNGNLKQRKLTKWIQTGPVGTDGYFAASRDAKPEREISIIIEGNQALATMSETEYDSNSDLSYFAHLNPKKVKSYHFIPLTMTQATEGTRQDLETLFSQQGQVATITETDYLYNEGYKARNILTLPLETRVINPANNQTIAKSQFVYDETSYPIIDYGTTTGYAAPTGTYANLRGNVTTTRVWNSTNDTWIETHAQYDQFGNLRKAWDASGNVNRFVETQYSPTYFYAYPTKAIAPAPDPTGTNGTTEKSEVVTTYDFNTGLPLTVTNKNFLSDSNDDVTVTTEYNDSLLRPTRTFVTPSGYAGETLVEYGDSIGNLYVKTKTQIDANNYAEATKYFDGIGRAYKVKAKDLAGDIFTETQFDEMGRVIKTSNPYRTGETPVWTETEYDSAGRVWKVKAPLEPNQTNRAVSETQYGLQTSGSSIGVMVLGIDPSGKKSLSLTNALGELVSVWEIKASDSDTEQVTFNGTTYNGYRTNYTYDTLGKLRKVTQGEQSRYFAYDSLGRLIRAKNVEQETNTGLPAYTDPVTGNQNWSQSFEYDTNGNIWKQTTARNITITNSYDALNRVTKRDYSDSTPDVDYFYDGTGLGSVPANSKGKLTKVTNGVSENRFVEFDLVGKVKTSQQITDGQTYECTYTYDSFGRLVSETYPSGRVVTNSFDSLGRLASVSSQVNQNQTPRIYANGFGYNDKGQPDRMRLGNGLWESIKYNNQFQVTQLGLGTSAAQTNKLKIVYDYGIENNNGNVLSQTITVPTVGSSNGFTATQVYEYDELNRLKGAVETEGTSQTNWEQHFRYDRYGNRTVITNENKQGQEPVTTESVVGLNPEVSTSTNRIVPKQNTTEQYQFDASGNMTRDDVGNTFTFDAENHQKTYTEQGQTEPNAFYHYDGDGKRVKKIVKVQSGQQTIDEITIFVYNGGGALVAEYTENITAPTNPQTVYLTKDALGTPRINTNQKGEVVARHDYLPFGDEINIVLGQQTMGSRYGHSEYVPDDVRQKFTGYEKDKETGLDFAQARYYGNRLGRFTSSDPSFESIDLLLPQSWNSYTYVLNNPLNLTDPSGLCPEQGCGDYEGTVYVDATGQNFLNGPQKGYTVYTGDEVLINDANSGLQYIVTAKGWKEVGPIPRPSEVSSPSPDNEIYIDECGCVNYVSNDLINYLKGPIPPAPTTPPKSGPVKQPDPTPIEVPERGNPDLGRKTGAITITLTILKLIIERRFKAWLEYKENHIRLRHYTNRKGIIGIETSGQIIPYDRGMVFFVKASDRVLSPRDAEVKLGIPPGHGRDYVETDFPKRDLTYVKNPVTGKYEIGIRRIVPLMNPSFVRRN